MPSAADGVVTFAETPNYEEPKDSGGDNGYEFTVVATDVQSGSSRRNVSQAVTVTVGDVEEGRHRHRGQPESGGEPDIDLQADRPGTEALISPWIRTWVPRSTGVLNHWRLEIMDAGLWFELRGLDDLPVHR